MQVTQDIESTRAACGSHQPLAFVPTMGALHEGHLTLIRRAKQICPRVAVSIFVNPTQFGPDEDFDRYPRPAERDLQLCKNEGVDLVFHPAANEIYPPDELETLIDVPALTTTLEGAHRPGHFVGVCRVVTKLLNIVQPHVACFGLKDYQQLSVIAAMVRGMCLPIEIEPCPTLREPDGLAMSSRNAYLSDKDRPRAVGIIKALREAEQLVAAGEINPDAVEAIMHQIIESHGFEIDYAVVRDARTLAKLDIINPASRPVVCLVAAKLGDVRLIDNLFISEQTTATPPPRTQ